MFGPFWGRFGPKTAILATLAPGGPWRPRKRLFDVLGPVVAPGARLWPRAGPGAFSAIRGHIAQHLRARCSVFGRFRRVSSAQQPGFRPERPLAGPAGQAGP